MRDEIAKNASAKGVMGGDGVTVNGEIIALEPASASSRYRLGATSGSGGGGLTPVGLRWLAIFGEVTMTQTVYVAPDWYPTLQSAVFTYEPRKIILIPMSQVTSEDYFPGITGTAVLPYIITGLPTYAQSGEVYPGQVIDDNSGAYYDLYGDYHPAYHFKKEAMIKFYARGYSDDALVDGVLPFARGRRAGDVKLTLLQAQSVLIGDPLEPVLQSASYEVTADYTGSSLPFTSFASEPLYGGFLATISLTGLQRPQ
jgi:hypothetical protein